MQIAYIVSAYKLPEQLVRLVRRLTTESSSCFVHVDRKSSDAVYHAMVRGLDQIPNVHFLKRHTCHWGGFGHVAATLEGLDAIARTRPDVDYVILLTGQDYPIKTNADIEQFLRQRPDTPFMDHFALPTENWEHGGLGRLCAWHFRPFGRRLRVQGGQGLLPKRRLPCDLRPYGGSSYWCLPRSCIEYVNEFVRSHAAYAKFFRYVDVPDEIFFQTIIMSSPFADATVNDDLRLIKWKDPDAASPSVLVTDDFADIVQSEKLFARKFDVTQDGAVLDLIDERILGYYPLGRR